MINKERITMIEREIDYKQKWETLKQIVNEKLREARQKDNAVAYNGGYSNYASKYEDFMEIIYKCERIYL